MKFNSSLDSAGLELLAADPSNKFEGRMYEDTVSKKAKVVLDAVVQSVVTEGQTQTLDNKTLNKPLVPFLVQDSQPTPVSPNFPPVGQYYYYTKSSDNRMYQIDSNGVETLVGGNYNVDELKAQLDLDGAKFEIGTFDPNSLPGVTVKNRPLLPDYTSDLSPVAGATKHMFAGSFLQAKGEYSTTSGTQISKYESDISNTARFVGSWAQATNGAIAQSNIAGDYVEFIFYGSGLNVFFNHSTLGIAEVLVTIDGGAENPIPVVEALPAKVDWGSRETGLYKRVTPTSMTVGWHVVRLRLSVISAYMGVVGYEILNEQPAGKFLVRKGKAYKGGRKYELAVNTLVDMDPELHGGLASTKGHRCVAYIGNDNVVRVASNRPQPGAPTVGPAVYTPGVNEELFAKYSMGDFYGWQPATPSTGNRHDFNNMSGTAQTLCGVTNDNIASLVLTNTIHAGQPSYPATLTTDNGMIKFTFFGTGLDVTVAAAAAPRNWTYTIDGFNPAVAPVVGSGAFKNTYKIASDLNVGWHTFTAFVGTTGGAAGLQFLAFTVYTLKKPVIPAEAIELADYYHLPDYVTNPNTSNTVPSVGVVKKPPFREGQYTDGTGGTTSWTGIATPFNFSTYGTCKVSDRLLASVEMTFYGTGCELHYLSATNGSTNVTVLVDGQIYNTTSFPGAGDSGANFDYVNGILNTYNAVSTNAEVLFVKGLPLGHHKIKLVNNVASKVVNFCGISAICKFVSVQSYGLSSETGFMLCSSGLYTNPTKYFGSGVRKTSIARIGGFATALLNIFFCAPNSAVTYVAEEDETVDIKVTMTIQHTAGSGFFLVLMMDDQPIEWVTGSIPTANFPVPYIFNTELTVPQGNHKFWIALRNQTAGTIIPTGLLTVSKKR